LRILITGVTGQIGSLLAMSLSKKHEIIAGVRVPKRFNGNYKTVRLDLNDFDTIKESIEEVRPDLIIHLASLTSTAFCEKNQELCEKINVEATAVLTTLSLSVGSRMVYLSTDLVFDGKKGNYNESDRPNPRSVYAKSKLEGEEAVKSIQPDSLIARTAIVIGKGLYNNGGFAGWVIDSLKNGQRINLFTNQFRSHFFINDSIYALTLLLEKEESGLFHLSGGNRESRYDFAVSLAKNLNLDDSLIKPFEIENDSSTLKLRGDCSLDNAKLVKATGFVPTEIREMYDYLKKDFG